MPAASTPTPSRSPRDHAPTWLCPAPIDRARIVEMEARLAPGYRIMRWAMPLSLAAVVPAVGAWALLPALVAGVFSRLTHRLMSRTSQPEYPVVLMALSLLVSLVVAAALTGGFASPLTYWLLMPTFALSARFRTRVVVVLLSAAAVALLVLSALLAPESVNDNPGRVVVFLVVGLTLTMFTEILTSAEYAHRQASSIDELTGLLNRRALTARFDELEQQAHHDDEPVALILSDLDHFKRINDTQGHLVGDEVLRATAQALRGGMRSFELVYRVGGEEFLVLLPGADPQRAAAMAEELRARVAAARPAGLTVTVSAGVAAARGTDVDFSRLYDAADGALYAAKEQGRNRVVVAGEAAPASAVPTLR